MFGDAATLGAVLRTQCREYGDKPLLVCQDGRLSYRDAERRSARLSRTLLGLGAGKGIQVGLLYPNGIDFVVAALAVARIGAVAVPFSTFATGPELRGQLVDADVAVLLAAPGYRAHDYRQRLAGELGVPAERFDSPEPLRLTAAPVLRRVLFGAEGDQTAPPRTDVAAVEDDVRPADPMAIIYTSGSTGPPKGAVHTHGGLLGHQGNLNAIRGLSAADRLFCNSPFFWIGGFAFGLLATLVAGATLICSDSTDPAATLDLLEAEKPTMGNGFAAGIMALTEDPSFPARDLSSMRRGNLYPLMPMDLRPKDPALHHNMLGMTEGGSVVLIDGDESEQPESRRGSYGKPAPGFEAKVIDPDSGAEMPVGTIGELCLRGRYLMQRYYGRSREECFDADGWFHTGDLVRTDADGYVYFIGRSGAMIKTAGANVTPAEVEKALTELTGCPAHVLGLPDAERGQVVAAVIVTPEPAAFDEAQVRAQLRATLSAYKVPRRFVAITPARLPVLSSGKIDLPALPRLFDA